MANEPTLSETGATPDVLATMAALAAASPSGSVNLTIDTGTTKYKLTMSIPTDGSGGYSFSLTSQPDAGGAADTLFSFTYTSETQYSVAATLPSLKIGSGSVSGGFTLSTGS